MNANRAIVDLRRHKGEITRISNVTLQYVANLGGATVDWLLRPDQTVTAPQGNRLELTVNSEADWGESVCRHMLDLRSTQGVQGPFWVLSYDNLLLNAVGAVASQGLTVVPVHFAQVFAAAKRLTTPRLGRVAASKPVGPGMSVDEASVIVRALLMSGGHMSPANPLPQKELRPRLVKLDSRALKCPGNFASESLIRNVVAKGRSEGWLVAFQAQQDKSGTEALYLVANRHLSDTVLLPGQPEPSSKAISSAKAIEAAASSAGPAVEVPPAVKQLRASEFEGFLASARIGAIPRTRDLIFDAVEKIVSNVNYGPLLLNDLLDVSLSAAQERAAELSYVQEVNWQIAGRCILRLMCRAGVLMNPKGSVIADRIGRDSHRVKSLKEDFRFGCEMYLAEQILRNASKFHYDDDTYYLGITIYRQGASDKLSASELKEKADALLTALEQSGRIEMGTDHLIRICAPVRKEVAVLRS